MDLRIDQAQEKIGRKLATQGQHGAIPAKKLTHRVIVVNERLFPRGKPRNTKLSETVRYLNSMVDNFYSQMR